MDNKLNFTLPSGTNVEMDLARFTVRTVMDARACANGGFKTTLYILADICKFNGEKVTAPELEDYSGFDLLELENRWSEAQESAVKKPQAPQKLSSLQDSPDGEKKKS